MTSAEYQRQRDLRRAVCGNCGGPAAEMRQWGGRRIPVCEQCRDALDEIVQLGLPGLPRQRPDQEH